MSKQVKQYTNPSLCAKCKGACCTKYSGIFAPDDFKLPVTQELIIALLLTKMVTIDFDDSYHTSSAKIYYPRPRLVDEDPIIPYTMQGTCSNWSYDKGCTLLDKEKPFQCRMFIPSYKDASYGCYYDKRDAADKTSMVERWMPHQVTLRIGLKKYKNIMHLKMPDFEPEATFFEKIADRLKLVQTSQDIQDNLIRELMP